MGTRGVPKFEPWTDDTEDQPDMTPASYPQDHDFSEFKDGLYFVGNSIAEVKNGKVG